MDARSSAAPTEIPQRSIVVRRATKVLGRGRHRYYVLDNASMVFDARHHYVVLGVPGAGKSTLLRLLCGMQKLGRGNIVRRCKVMPPLGTAHAFSDGATGRELCKIFAQLYDADPSHVIQYTWALSGLGDHFDRSTLDMPAEMRARLSFALGYAVPADIYLFDGYFGAGTTLFRERCKAAFEQRQRTSGTIFATRNLRAAPTYGDRGVIVHNAKLYEFNTVEEAIYSCHYLELEPQHGTLSYAEGLLGKGKVEEARDYLEDSGLVGPDNPAACELYARLASELGDDPSAKSAALNAVAADPSLSPPHLLLAQIAARADDNRGVIRHSEAFLALEPGHVDALRNLAQAYEIDGAHASAAKIWRAMAKTSANPVAARLALRCELKAVSSELHAGDYLAALDLVEASPSANDISFMEMKAAALRGLRRWDELNAVIRQIGEIDAERALAVVHKTILEADADRMALTLDALPTELIAKTALSRQWTYITSHLLKSVRQAQKVEFHDTADRLAAAMARVQATREGAP